MASSQLELWAHNFHGRISEILWCFTVWGGLCVVLRGHAVLAVVNLLWQSLYVMVLFVVLLFDSWGIKVSRGSRVVNRQHATGHATRAASVAGLV